MSTLDDKPEWAWSERDKRRAARREWTDEPSRRPWRRIAVVAILLAVVVYFAWSLLSPGSGPAPGGNDRSGLVMQLNSFEVLTVEPARLTEPVRISGTMSPLRQTSLSSQVTGEVDEVYVRSGDRVQQGDVLVQIDARNLSLQLEQQRNTAAATRAQLALAESQLQRTRTLSSQGLTTSSGLEQEESNVAALRANLAALEGQVTAAEIALQNATIRAPFSGIVSARSVEPRQTIGAGSPVVSLVDLAVIEMQVTVPFAVSSQIAPGQPVTVVVGGLPGTFEGVVDRINPVAFEGTRSIPVYILIENPDEVLRGGMFATGQIVIDERAEAIAVPIEAVREDDAGRYVLKLQDGRVQRQPVETGAAWNRGELVEIVSGLEAGDTIVSIPLPELLPGDSFELARF